MPRLIDANAVDYENIMCSQSQLHWLNAIIEKQPTIDAVEVVRCKDCKQWKRHTKANLEYGSCNLFHCTRKENGYCELGERRDHG